MSSRYYRTIPTYVSYAYASRARGSPSARLVPPTKDGLALATNDRRMMVLPTSRPASHTRQRLVHEQSSACSVSSISYPPEWPIAYAQVSSAGPAPAVSFICLRSPVTSQTPSAKAMDYENIATKRRPAFDGACFDSDGFCLAHGDVRIAKRLEDGGFKTLRTTCYRCSLTRSTASTAVVPMGMVAQMTQRRGFRPVSSESSRVEVTRHERSLDRRTRFDGDFRKREDSFTAAERHMRQKSTRRRSTISSRSFAVTTLDSSVPSRRSRRSTVDVPQRIVEIGQDRRLPMVKASNWDNWKADKLRTEDKPKPSLRDQLKSLLPIPAVSASRNSCQIGPTQRQHASSLPFDCRGYCTVHKSVRLATKSRGGKWTTILASCPICHTLQTSFVSSTPINVYPPDKKNKIKRFSRDNESITSSQYTRPLTPISSRSPSPENVPKQMTRDTLTVVGGRDNNMSALTRHFLNEGERELSKRVTRF